MTDAPDLMTIPEVSTYLRVPAETLSKWRRLHKGPPYLRYGKHIRYRRVDVADWLLDCTTPA